MIVGYNAVRLSGSLYCFWCIYSPKVPVVPSDLDFFCVSTVMETSAFENAAFSLISTSYQPGCLLVLLKRKKTKEKQQQQYFFF